jgi:GT2 family glycosyltransferase
MSDNQRKKLVVVLGMHRSGTSVVTRGLLAMGIELGSNLMPAAGGVNEKGFWEDVDFNAINIAILHAIGHDWHTLDLITEAELLRPDLATYQLKATEMLRDRLAERIVFGLKDPRTVRLLPFWKKIFDHLDLDVTYIIVSRNPISIARSLMARDGVPAEKSHYLWLQHIVDAIVYTTGEKRIAINYDRLMDEPKIQLDRLAAFIGPGSNALTSTRLDEFIQQFLEEGLRHTRFTDIDLEIDPDVTPWIIEVYECINRFCTDSASIDAPAVDELFVGYKLSLENIASLLRFANRLEQQLYAAHLKLADQQTQLEKMQGQLAEMQVQKGVFLTDQDLQRETSASHLQALAQSLSMRIDEIKAILQAQEMRELQITQLKAMLHDKEIQLGELNNILSENSRQITDLIHALDQCKNQNSNLSQSLEEGNEKIKFLQKTAADQDEKYRQFEERITNVKIIEGAVARLEAELFSANQERSRLATALKATYASRSWRITSILRVSTNRVRAGRHSVKTAASNIVRRAYHSLPLSVAWKLRVKDILFSSFGFALTRSVAYQQWKVYQEFKSAAAFSLKPVSYEIAPDLRSSDSAVSVSHVQADLAERPELWKADGVREWVDYHPVRERIRLINKTRFENRKCSPPPIINVDARKLSEAIQKVAVPACDGSPKVSIILPVFNNLKYTIECLLSISQNTSVDMSYEIIIADDASEDSTASVLSAIPNLRITSNIVNLGFLRNCNRAAELAKGEYILFLNNDVQVQPGWLDAMIKVFRDERDVGAVGPKIIYPNGFLQEAGVTWRRDGTAEMIGLSESPTEPRFNYQRDVDYCSGACLLLKTQFFKSIGGFDERFAPAYCEDSDLCLQVRAAGLRVVYCPEAVIVHHLSKTSDALGHEYKLECIARNLGKLTDKWQADLDRHDDVRVLALYLPQFHPIAENDRWWGKGFTEWANVTKARPNFVGHYQPRRPADLGYYDLRVASVMQNQAELAKRYGIDGFCFYYYWFGGKRLLEEPVERLLLSGQPDIPFCLCWANENWTRRWDGRDSEILMAQSHSDADDLAVIQDLMRYFRSANYIRVNGKPLILIYRVTLFPDFARTSDIWRKACQQSGIGDIYITIVESFELVHKGVHPSHYGCDASMEFPPQELAEARAPSGQIINPDFRGMVADYRELAVRYATRPYPAYTRFSSVTPGWDNTARRQNEGFCFEHSSPGAMQAWLESAIELTKQQHSGDERIVFVNAWNEWAEGAYLEPDSRFGHTFLEAVRNAREASSLMRMHSYALGE